MKIDMKKLQDAVDRIKVENSNSTGSPHECWVPMPEKQFAKENGVKWNATLNRHEFYAVDPNSHPCSKFLPSNFTKLTGKVPFGLKDTFKELGVINCKIDDDWSSYVMLHEDYIKLVEALQECGLL